MTRSDKGRLFPESAMTASRCELSDILLKIDGKLPDDLQGHVFIVAPVGTVNSGGLPSPDGTHIFNGDGMIYRLDFHRPGEVGVKTRLAKPPCYYADRATRPGTAYAKYQFCNHGLLRFSPDLGLRDELDIAFLQMKFASEEQERLLVTYDAGRPYEIDTETLEVVTPVGANTEWRACLPFSFPFPPVLSTSHPAFDAHTNEAFFVNYGKSLGNLLESIRFVYDLEEVPQEVEELFGAISQFLERSFLKDLFGRFSRFSQDIFQLCLTSIEKITGIELKDFVYVISWDGVGDLQRWKLILADGSPVKIEQSIHQIGVTRDYVVLMDTSLKIGPEQLLNNPIPDSLEAERFLRDLLTRPQLPDSIIYIVRRADLKAGQRPVWSQKEVEVVAHRAVIPLESVHFLLDYDNPDGQITLHAAHLCATDIAEWVRRYDTSEFNPPNPAPSRLRGMLSNGQMDINRLGRYVIDGQSAQILDSKVIYDIHRNWGVGFYTYRDRLPSGQPPEKLENIYWQSLGFWPELLTEFIFNLYKDYKYRAVSVEEILRVPEEGEGRPSCLFRLDTITMEIADSYNLPEDHFISSPQFVPRANNEGGSMDGYIVCTVFFKNSNEIWIFDAKALASGPKCKLKHPSLNFGFTMHTAWLPTIAPRTASYDIPVRQDYENTVKQKSPKIQELFEKDVYPYFK